LDAVMMGGLDSFDFSLCERNNAIMRQMEEAGHGAELRSLLKLTSSGTTIVGSVFEGGVVLGGDTRSTSGNIVADKHSLKVHYLTDRIFACGAGTAADLKKVAQKISAELKLYELNSGKKARVAMAVRRVRQYLFQYMGYVGCYYLIGGVDSTGSHIFSTHAHGTGLEKAFESEGSGSLSALAELETGFKPKMTESECIDLVKKGLEAGMHGDNNSGNSYNLVIVKADKMRREGPFKPAFCVRPDQVENSYKYAPGTTKMLSMRKLETVAQSKDQEMET